jgi:hypothetical protein
MQAMPLATNSNSLYHVEIRMLACLKSAERGQGAMPKNRKALQPNFPVTLDAELLSNVNLTQFSCKPKLC